MSRFDFHDSLDDILGECANAPIAPRPVSPPPSYIPASFTEPCKKCGGSGRYGNLGACFACNGKGKLTYKTSSETRAKARAKASERKAAPGLEYRQANPHIAQWIASNPNFAFAVSIGESIDRFGSLTERQESAVLKCIANAAERDAKRAAEKAQRVESAPVVSVDKIEEAFNNARAAGLKRLRLKLATFVFKPAKESSVNAGALYVTRQDIYLGKIASGRFMASRDCTPDTAAEIVRVASDPKSAAIAYGKQTGICSCCGAELTDPKSIARGIGPICADNWGM